MSHHQGLVGEGTHILSEILGQISYNITAFGEPCDNPQLTVAATHGTGYLTGGAAALIEDAAVDQDGITSAEWEADLICAAELIVMAIIDRRRRDAETVSADDEGNSPIGGEEAPLDELLRNLSAAGFTVVLKAA